MMPVRLLVVLWPARRRLRVVAPVGFYPLAGWIFWPVSGGRPPRLQ